jgi:hypothetical protein
MTRITIELHFPGTFWATQQFFTQKVKKQTHLKIFCLHFGLFYHQGKGILGQNLSD